MQEAKGCSDALLHMKSLPIPNPAAARTAEVVARVLHDLRVFARQLTRTQLLSVHLVLRHFDVHTGVDLRVVPGQLALAALLKLVV